VFDAGFDAAFRCHARGGTGRKEGRVAMETRGEEDESAKDKDALSWSSPVATCRLPFFHACLGPLALRVLVAWGWALPRSSTRERGFLAAAAAVARGSAARRTRDRSLDDEESRVGNGTKRWTRSSDDDDVDGAGVGLSLSLHASL